MDHRTIDTDNHAHNYLNEIELGIVDALDECLAFDKWRREHLLGFRTREAELAFRRVVNGLRASLAVYEDIFDSNGEPMELRFVGLGWRARDDLTKRKEALDIAISGYTGS